MQVLGPPRRPPVVFGASFEPVEREWTADVVVDCVAAMRACRSADHVQALLRASVMAAVRLRGPRMHTARLLGCLFDATAQGRVQVGDWACLELAAPVWGVVGALVCCGGHVVSTEDVSVACTLIAGAVWAWPLRECPAMLAAEVARVLCQRAPVQQQAAQALLDMMTADPVGFLQACKPADKWRTLFGPAMARFDSRDRRHVLTLLRVAAVAASLQPQDIQMTMWACRRGVGKEGFLQWALGHVASDDAAIVSAAAEIVMHSNVGWCDCARGLLYDLRAAATLLDTLMRGLRQPRVHSASMCGVAQSLADLTWVCSKKVMGSCAEFVIADACFMWSSLSNAEDVVRLLLWGCNAGGTAFRAIMQIFTTGLGHDAVDDRRQQALRPLFSKGTLALHGQAWAQHVSALCARCSREDGHLQHMLVRAALTTARCISADTPAGVLDYVERAAVFALRKPCADRSLRRIVLPLALSTMQLVWGFRPPVIRLLGCVVARLQSWALQGSSVAQIARATLQQLPVHCVAGAFVVDALRRAVSRWLQSLPGTAEDPNAVTMPCGCAVHVGDGAAGLVLSAGQCPHCGRTMWPCILADLARV